MADNIRKFGLMKITDTSRPERFFPLFSSVSNLAGVGPKATKSLQNLGVTRIRDLLFFLPVGGIVRIKTSNILSIVLPAFVTIEVIVNSHHQSTRNGPVRVLVNCSGVDLELVFFHARLDWIKSILPINETKVISGKLESFVSGLQIVHPDYIIATTDLETVPDFEPVYPLSKGISQKILIKIISQATGRNILFEEWINKSVIKSHQWLSFQKSVSLAHRPTNISEVQPKNLARERLAFDELFAHQISLALARKQYRKTKGISIKSSGLFANQIRKALPFSLTEAQDKAICHIKKDLMSDLRMNRLLQGDVGSGKTIVALLTILTVVEFGGQACLLAPTEILARQHYDTIIEITKIIKVNILLLTGRDKGSLRRNKLDQIESGSAKIIIGTHALFQESVVYKNLLFAVIDEQHRFGVRQRMELGNKGPNVDVLVMTATPIPRSLSLTYYGDMDISILDEKPKNRMPIKTAVMSDGKIKSILDRLEKALCNNRRVYWVCPLIEDSEVLALTSAEYRFDILKERFPTKNVGLVHGQMSVDEKDEVMRMFADGEISLLVSTTVIEVGVDVPSASIIIIEGAERFGLAQLHQLRGRVGRGSDQSSCILIYSGNLGKNSKARLEILRDTEDGFKISEEDLKIRGAGDVLGIQQSGLPQFLVANLETQNNLLEIARDDARLLLDIDPNLTSERGMAVRELLYLMDLQRSLQYIKVG